MKSKKETDAVSKKVGTAVFHGKEISDDFVKSVNDEIKAAGTRRELKCG